MDDPVQPPGGLDAGLHHGVHDLRHHDAGVQCAELPVGRTCTTCANIGPTQAITLPDRQMVQKIEREHKMLAIVRKEAAAKHAKRDAERTRAQAEDTAANTVSRIALHIAGEDISGFLNEVRSLIRENRLLLANENRV